MHSSSVRGICIKGIFWTLFCLEENQSRQNNKKSQKHIDSAKVAERLKISICLTESVSNRVRYFIQRHLYFEVLHFDFCLVWYLAQQWNGMSHIFFSFYKWKQCGPIYAFRQYVCCLFLIRYLEFWSFRMERG